MKTIRLDQEVVVKGRDFRVSLWEDLDNRELVLHLYTDATELQPRPLTKFLKLGTSDINGQVVVLKAVGHSAEPEFRSPGGVKWVD